MGTAKYRVTLTILTLVSVIIPIILTIFFVYLSYIRAQRRLRRAQANATIAAKAVCSTILNIEANPFAGPIRTAVGDQVNNACSSLLAS